MISKSCFLCALSEIEEGDDSVGLPACTICLEPLAAKLEEEYIDLITKIDAALNDIIFKNTAEFRNCAPEDASFLNWRIKYAMVNTFNLFCKHGDFAEFCPMYTPDQRRVDKWQCQ